MKEETNIAQPQNSDLISITLSHDWSLAVQLSPIPILVLVGIVVIGFLVLKFLMRTRFSEFEIDCAEIGLGDHKISLKPNDTDRQIAYSIWVELSTRKIGLPIDLEHDVIDEIYNSWYEFFGITRSLIKDIPVSKARQDSTRKIIELSIEVLNEGLRPHLNRWQARYRKWHSENLKDHKSTPPQAYQQEFPRFEELSTDLLSVNEKLIAYKMKMKELIDTA